MEERTGWPRTDLACARVSLVVLAVLLVSCAESGGPASPEVVGVQQHASALSICVGDYAIGDVDTAADLAAVAGCTVISGNLTIATGDELTDLTGLSSLTSVDYLFIYSNYALADLDGLSNLTSVYGMEIFDNGILTSVDGLST